MRVNWHPIPDDKAGTDICFQKACLERFPLRPSSSMHVQILKPLRTLIVLITLVVSLCAPARMAAAIDRFAIQFDGASTGTGNVARPLSLVFELTGFASPQGVLTIYIGQLAMLDAPSEVTELFGPLTQYALDQSMNPGTLDLSGATGQPSHLLFTLSRKSEISVSQWDLRMVGEKATLIGTSGNRTYTFVGRIKGYEPTGNVSEELPLPVLLIAGGIGLVALIGLGWFWDIRAKKAAAEKLRRRALEGYAASRQISGFDGSGRPIYLATDPQMIRLARTNKVVSVILRAIFLVACLLLLRVDGAWLRSDIREAFLRPMSMAMDVPVSFWLTSAVVTPWQLMSSSALFAALIHGWLRGPASPQVLTLKQFIALLVGALILFLGLMGHATPIGVLGLSIVLATLLLPTLSMPVRMRWLVISVVVLMSVPLPESILASVQGRIGIPPIGKLGFVAVGIDILVGISFAIWFGDHRRKKQPLQSQSGSLDYAVLAAGIMVIATYVCGYRQHQQVQAQSAWMPIAPLQIGRYKTRLVDVDAAFLALVGKPKAKLYEYRSPGAPDIVMTVVNGAHLDAYHDPTICMAQGDFVYKGLFKPPPGLLVRRLEFASQSRPSHRLVLDYWEQDRDGGIGTAAKMGRLKHLPNRIIKGLGQLSTTPPVVIIRAQVECDGSKACARAENALSVISRNVQTAIR